MTTQTHKKPIRGRQPQKTAEAPVYFVVRTSRGANTPPLRVSVPVRVQSLAVRRNRIRRQVTEAFRGILRNTKHPAITVIVRRADIPIGKELEKIVLELLREFGMIKK